MKKLFFTAVAVLAFSGAGFAESGVKKSIKDFKISCGDFARGARWAFYQSAGGDPSIEEAARVYANALAYCRANLQ